MRLLWCELVEHALGIACRYDLSDGVPVHFRLWTRGSAFWKPSQQQQYQRGGSLVRIGRTMSYYN
jgi:hypothetical protein